MPLALAATLACGKSADSEGQPKAKTVESAPAPVQEPTPLTQAQLEELYRSAKARTEAPTQLDEATFAALRRDLERIAEQAEDKHLRANASLLLGSLFEARGDSRSAISFYRQARELVPEEVSTHTVLALALAGAERWDEAIEIQWDVVRKVPDDLTAWLLLGELHVKGGKLDEAPKIYGAYELRRKGLLEGLTGKKDGAYLLPEVERLACAEALAPAVDNGTAVALMYALDSDPSPAIRRAVATIMGEQRLLGYRKLLEQRMGSETDAKVKETMAWALEQIAAEGLETAPGPVPDQIREQVEAEMGTSEAGIEPGTPVPEAGDARGDKDEDKDEAEAEAAAPAKGDPPGDRAATPEPENRTP